MEIPFQIHIADSAIEQLQQKLAATVFPNELDGAGWDYGAPLADITRLVARWRSGYDWRKQEALMNSRMPQFTRDIHVDGFGNLNIHYVHQKSAVEGAIPLLFVHGCKYPSIIVVAYITEVLNLEHFEHSLGPGSFLEVQKILRFSWKDPPSIPLSMLWPSVFRDTVSRRDQRRKVFRQSSVQRRVNKSNMITKITVLKSFQVGNALMLALGYQEYGEW